jgi:membrane protease YdiL (CAAX protease family)
MAPTRDIFEIRSPGQLLAMGMGVVAVTFLLGAGFMHWLEHARTAEILANLIGLIGLPILYLRAHAVEVGPTLRVHVPTPGQIAWLAMASITLLPPLLVIGEWSQRILPPPPEYFEALQEILPHSAAQWIVTLVSVAVIAPLGEELVFRGIVQQAARRAAGGRTAAILAGLLFAVWHGQSWNLATLLVLGIFVGLVFETTGSMIACVVVHGAYNVCVLLLYTYGEQLPALEGIAGAFIATVSMGLAWGAHARLRPVRAWESAAGGAGAGAEN